DLFWLTAFWLFAMGAAAQHAAARRSQLIGVEPADALHEAPPLAHGVLPYASVAIVYLFLAVIAGPELGERTAGVLWSAVGVTALVLVRQFVAIRENTRLLAERAARASETRFRTLVQ